MITARRHALCAALVLGLGALSCGGAPRQPKTGEFPTRADLANLTASRSPSGVKVGSDLDAGAWKLKGPIPDAIEDAPEDGSTPWGKMALDAAAKRPDALLATKSMGCAAREAASFLVARKALPGRTASRFIAGWCGVPISYLKTSSVTVSGVAAGKSDAEVWSGLRGDVERMLGDLGKTRSFIGVGFARSGGDAGVVVATAKRLVRLERTPLVQGEDSVVLRGEALRPIHELRALATAGLFGYEACKQDESVKLPRFSIRCPILRVDPSVTIEVLGFGAGRVLGDTMLEVVVFPSAPSLSFPGRAASDAAVSGDKTAVVKALVDRVNAVRKDAGMAPLRLSEAESAIADKLAPHYFAATSGSLDPSVADQVVLGLMAGWDVEGDVREGHFSSAIYGRRDPAGLLDALAARPFGRKTLFDPGASALAVGVLASDNDAIGAVIGTYTLFDPAAKTDDEMGRLVNRITRLREAKGLPVPRLMAELSEDTDAAVAKVKQGAAPHDAMAAMIHASQKRLGRKDILGWALTGPTVESLEIPPELSSAANLSIAVSIDHHRKPGHPWREILAFVLAAPGEAH